jgi:prepilin-type N-terminal cleavage/methylation domain-containing protein
MLYKLIRKKDRGFTLIEMLAVLMIAGVLMAIATPSVLAMMARARLSNSVDRVQDTLELSRSQTTQKNKKCNVYIPTDSNQIVSDCLISADNTSSGIAGVDDGLPSVKLDDRDDIIIKNSDSSISLTKITYNVKGITQNSGTVVLLSRSNPTGEKKCLIVEAGIGIVRTGKYIDNICQVGE